MSRRRLMAAGALRRRTSITSMGQAGSPRSGLHAIFKILACPTLSYRYFELSRWPVLLYATSAPSPLLSSVRREVDPFPSSSPSSSKDPLRFNDLRGSSGASRPSRYSRFRELESVGLITRDRSPNGEVRYALTPAGRDLGPVAHRAQPLVDRARGPSPGPEEALKPEPVARSIWGTSSPAG